MTQDHKPVAFDPFFGGFILETLTIGMYGEARNALREYIQNAFDSIQKAIEQKTYKAGEGWIQVSLASDRRSVTIRDNGAGLPSKSAALVLTRVGASTKSHRTSAGFRGIGRLAGIVFSDTVRFTTKAKGEHLQTTVVFNAKSMRDAMAPGKASTTSAEDLMRQTVEAFQTPVTDANDHFFEVTLDGLSDPPPECLSALEMCEYLSEVAPVPYPVSFPYLAEIKSEARRRAIPIEEVRLTVQDGSGVPRPVTKRYIDAYDFESGKVTLSECSFYHSPSKRWWAWVGKKTESGAYTDSRVSGLRVRVRNIQIDGSAIVRDIFRELGKSQIRFQDYFLGEVFVEAGALVPNARRDGFEEDGSWKEVKKELLVVASQLNKEAYRVSKQGKYSVESLKANLAAAKKDLGGVRRAEFSDKDKVVKLSLDVTKYQKSVAKAALGADLEAAAEIQAIGSGLADIKQEVSIHLGTALPELDREKIQQDARDELLSEILSLLETALQPSCFASARGALIEAFGEVTST